MIILFDANCEICRKIKNLLESVDSDGVFQFISIQNHDVYTKYDGINYWEARKTIHIIDENNNVYKSEQAVLKILDQIRLLKPLKPLLKTKLALSVTAIAYEALNKYRLQKIKDCDDCQL